MISSVPKQKAKAQEKKPRPAQSERLKTVVRRLPPNLPEDIFWQTVQTWVTEDTVQWKAYYPGKFRKRLGKENIPSRAYIAFRDEEILADFSREYDGHLFRDKAGNESIAVVEFAPFQKIPSDKKKLDSRIATIEKDEDYISFLESLKDVGTKPFDAENLDTLIAATQPPPQPTTTPLLEALKAEKSAQKDKESILRNHAHYKDQSAHAGGGGGKREDGKKKASSAQAAQKPNDGSLSKKAAKKAAAAAKQHAQQASAAAESSNATAKNASTSGPSTPGKQAAAGQSAAPKPPRAPRERLPPKAAPVPAPQNSSAAPTSTTPADASTAAPPEPASTMATQPRRARPMLGLASRQFEAALSEAGVSGGERKARKERERTPAAVSPVAAAPVPAAGKGKQKESKAPAARAAAAPPVILQRDGQAPGVLARQGPGDGSGAPTLGETGVPGEDGAGAAGRGGRSRGRGRGRGGARGSG